MPKGRDAQSTGIIVKIKITERFRMVPDGYSAYPNSEYKIVEIAGGELPLRLQQDKNYEVGSAIWDSELDKFRELGIKVVDID